MPTNGCCMELDDEARRAFERAAALLQRDEHLDDEPAGPAREAPQPRPQRRPVHQGSRRAGLPPPPKGPMDIGDDEESQGRFMPKSGIGVSAPEVNVTLDNEAVVEAIEKNAQSSKQIVELLKAMKQEGSRSGTFTSPFHSSVMEWRS